MKVRDAKLKGLPLKKDGSQLPKGEFFMLKKHKIILILIIILLLSSTVVQAAESLIDKTSLNSGVIKIDNNGKVGAVRVTKGDTKYDHIIKGNVTIPLQLGNGDYTIQLLENAGGTSYKQLSKETITLDMVNLNDVYLQSIQKINWNNDMEAIKKAKSLTKNLKTDKEKVEAIYKYIITNISYDYDKAKKLSTVKTGYNPIIDDTLKIQTGICYDYSSLMGGMLRSLGIPTKLIMGYKSDMNEYHAWNQVYIEDQWLNIDTTYDAALKKGKKAVTMIKEASEYTIKYEY